jgi:hypothetical protein
MRARWRCVTRESQGYLGDVDEECVRARMGARETNDAAYDAMSVSVGVESVRAGRESSQAHCRGRRVHVRTGERRFEDV